MVSETGKNTSLIVLLELKRGQVFEQRNCAEISTVFFANVLTKMDMNLMTKRLKGKIFIDDHVQLRN